MEILPVEYCDMYRDEFRGGICEQPQSSLVNDMFSVAVGDGVLEKSRTETSFFMNKKTIVGIVLIFPSGIFHTRTVAAFITIFGGGMIRDPSGDLIVPPPAFYDNVIFLTLYSLPFLISGLYIIHRSCCTAES